MSVLLNSYLGIVNRGDSFRRRRLRSGSLAPSSPAQSAPETQERRPVALHRVAMVGAPWVGKTALISQFQTSECINAYDGQRGIVNLGDSFRRRRSRSGSLAPSSPAQSAPETQESRPVALLRVAMVGAPGVGKTALISQFQTSECINAYDGQRGIVNRGDSFRRRRLRSGSLAPSSPAQSASETQEHRSVALHRVAMVEAPTPGAALISQFQTSECINAYDGQRDIDSTEQKVSIMLNREESELYFINGMTTMDEIDRSEPPDAFVVIYSVVDKASFQRAEQELARLLDGDMLRARPALLAALRGAELFDAG